MTTTSAPNQATPSRSRRIFGISLAIIAALVVAFFVFASLYADWLWYEQLGFDSVLFTQWGARVVMFVIGFLGMAVPVWRIPVFFGFFAGFAASAQWETTWLWFNGVKTDVVDPQFGMDTGFYLFGMPFYTALVGFVSAVLLVCLLMTALVSYLYGAVRIGQRELRISKSARIQLAVLAGLYLLVQGASLWLDRFQTLVEPGALGRITGPGHTEANAVIPGLTILSIVAIVVALLFFITAIFGRWRYPLLATALLLISAVVVGVGYPWVVTTFQVRPNQFGLEQEFYERNLDMTKSAYGIDGLEKSDFTAETDAAAGQLREDAETTASIRIMDPAIIGPTVRQLEQYRAYYQFREPLDVDRYEIDGQSQDTIVSVRELNVSQLGAAANWQTNTLVYTHGYGIVAAAGNERTDDGNPVFLERGIPAAGFLSDQEDFQPRVYFGESSPPYSIVGAPEGAEPVELDYPFGPEGESQTSTTFTGDGGPSVGSIFNRLIYALKFQSEQILFADAVNEESQILYDRDPRLRVQKAAPYLTLDSDPYPSVVDGRIVWIIDGYTLSANYPYSTTVSLQRAIADANNTAPRFALDDINYVRNSVKATVDAYDGSVTLYAWDEEDPLLQAWQKIYPSTLEPISEMSGELMSHVRYPTDLFKIQRAMLGVYHVDDARAFFARDNAWATPNDPQTDARLQPPYYLTMQMPGQDSPSYSMFTTFIPSSEAGTASRNVLMGYLAVDSNAGSAGGQKDEDYGKLRMLQISAETTVPGPGQVQNRFDSDTAVSSQINILQQGQSEVLNGNLLTLPLGGGLLYVQPVFVQASQGTQLPTLRKVLVAFGDNIAFEDTLDQALDVIFGGDSGANAGDGDVDPTPSPTDPTPDPTEPVDPTDPVDPPVVGTEFEQALAQAQAAMLARDAALKAGDLTAFAAADAELTAAVERLIALGGQ